MSKTELAPQANEICRISRGSKVKGILTSSSDIRIDGTFEGHICTKGKLVVGDDATVDGQVIAQSLDLWGKMKGEILVEESVTLKSSASFEGLLKTSKICIEMGAVFNGPCSIISSEEFAKLSKEQQTEEDSQE